MVRPVRGHQMARSQQEGKIEPGRDPQQGEQSDTAGEKVIADYNADIDCERSEPEVEPDAQEQREVDLDTEYAKMETFRDETLC